MYADRLLVPLSVSLNQMLFAAIELESPPPTTDSDEDYEYLTVKCVLTDFISKRSRQMKTNYNLY